MAVTKCTYKYDLVLQSVHIENYIHEELYGLKEKENDIRTLNEKI